MTVYKADRTALLAQMENLQGKAVGIRTEAVSGLKSLLSDDVWTLYAGFSPEEKRRFWRGIIERIEFSKEREYTIIFL